ncbi:MAG TPA: hypothetical protein VGA37_05660 [Gemmatimonadales bacterium]
MTKASPVIAPVSLMLLCVAVGPLEAQRGPPGFAGFRPAPAIGIRAGRDFDGDAWSVGGQLRFPFPFLAGIELEPSGDVYLGDGDTEWQVNVDAVMPVRVFFLYVGGGLAVVRGSYFGDGVVNTETGYNLLVGMQFPFRRLPLRPFAEARWTFIKIADPFRLVAGLSLSLRGILPDGR